jgi:hypothetical protein
MPPVTIVEVPRFVHGFGIRVGIDYATAGVTDAFGLLRFEFKPALN